MTSYYSRRHKERVQARNRNLWLSYNLKWLVLGLVMLGCYLIAAMLDYNVLTAGGF